MKVLVINCGSSSLKYQLIDSQSEEVLAKGLCERIGIEGSSVTHQKAGEGKKTEAVLMKDHTDAVKVVIEKLTDPAEGVIASLKEIDAVGHRIVHGGEKFKGSVVIDDSVLEAIAECNESGKPDRYQILPEDNARCADGGCIRYRIPSDDARQGLFIRSAV